MGFRFEYGSSEREPDRSPPPPVPPRRRRRADQRRGLTEYWHRLPRWRKATVAVVLVLTASTIITSRDRGSDQVVVEGIAAPSPAVDANGATTTLSTTRLTPVEQEPPPTTAAIATVDWARLALSVVYIEAGECPSFPADMYNSGSGTVVMGGTHVLTNAHVVLDDEGRPCRDLVVWFTRSFEEEPSERVRVGLLAVDGELDLAVLRLNEPASADRSIEVTAQRMEPGETIRILGYPGAGGLTMTLTRGAYSGMVDHGSETYVKTDAALGEGNSGGAAFNEAGIFVGVPTAGIEQVGLLIPADAAERFLDRARRS